MTRTRATGWSHLTLVATLLLGAGNAAALTLLRGPYLQDPRDDGIVIAWDLDEPAQPELRFGLDPDYGETVVPDTVATHHELRLTGLAPGTTYHYALYLDGEPLSAPFTFPTAVPSGEDFRFAVVGDTRSRQDVHAGVIDAVAAELDVRFYLNTGDLVSDGEEDELWDGFFEAEAPMIARKPLFPSIGNHDEHDGRADNYTDGFVLPTESSGHEEYYSFDYGSVHVTALDSAVHVQSWIECIAERNLWVEPCFDVAQSEWLEADLRAAAANPAIDHIVIFLHVGPYTSKENRVGNGHMRELLPFFREVGVTAIFSGHDHYYERGLSDGGLPYVVTGGGGAPLYDIGAPIAAPHEVIYNEKIEHYILVDVDGPLLHLAVKTPDGRLIDETTFDSSPTCGDDADCGGATPPFPCADVAGTLVCGVGGHCIWDCNPEPPVGADTVEPGPSADAGEPPFEDVVDAGAAAPDLPPSADAPAAGPDTAPTDGSGGGCLAAPSHPVPGAIALFLLLGLVVIRRARA